MLLSRQFFQFEYYKIFFFGIIPVALVAILFSFLIQNKEESSYKKLLYTLSFDLGLLVIVVGWASSLYWVFLDGSLYQNLTGLGQSIHARSARVIGLLIIGLIGLLLIYAARKYYDRVYYTSWWDPSDKAPGKPFGWNDVSKIIHIANITSCPKLACPPTLSPCDEPGCPIKEIRYTCSKDKGNDFDPVWYIKKPRQYVWGECIRDVLVIGLVTAAFTGIIFFIFADFRFLKPILQELAIPGSILAAIGGGIMAVLQLSANVRSKNRQEWIDELRALLSEIMDVFMRFPGDHISELPGGAYRTAMGTKKAEIFRELNSKRIKLEMMLNPSEKEHRTLMMLIRVALGIKIPNVDALVIRALNIEAEIKADNARERDDSSHVDLVSMIFRLSHVVLKREWERVKYAQ